MGSPGGRKWRQRFFFPSSTIAAGLLCLNSRPWHKWRVDFSHLQQGRAWHMAQRLPIGRTGASMDSNCYRPAFYHACERGDLAEIRRHLDEGAKLEGQSLPLGRTGDGRAVWFREDLPGLRNFANGNFDPPTCTFDVAEDHTPLLVVARRGKVVATRLLLERGADPNVKIAVERSAQIQYRSGQSSISPDWIADECTPLLLACKAGHAQVASLLLDFGAEVNFMTVDGFTALSYACKATGEPVDVVTLLLDRGADITKGRSEGLRPNCFCEMTPLRYAVRNHKLNIVRLLLARGAPVDQGSHTFDPEREGCEEVFESPLYMMCRICFYVPSPVKFAVVRLLLAHGASFELQHLTFWEYSSGPLPPEFTTPLWCVRDAARCRLPGAPEMNALFDDYLKKYWTLRYKLRLFGDLDEYLSNYLASFIIGDGVMSTKRT